MLDFKLSHSARKVKKQGGLGLCAIIAACCCLFLISSQSASFSSEPVSRPSIIYYLDRTMSAPEAGVILALEKGYFKDEGLNVRIVEGAIDRQRAVTASDQSIAIGTASVFDFFRTRAAGQRLVAFASAFTRNPIVFYVRRDSKIRSIADFSDKVVAYDAGHATAIVFDALLTINRVSKSTIKSVAGQQTVSAFGSQAIDILPGYIGRESNLLDKMGIPFDQINPAAFSLHLPGSVYLTDEETLRTSPDAVKRFLRALIRGWNTAYLKDSADLNTIAKALGLPDVKAASEMLDQQRPLLRPSGRRFAELDPTDMKKALAVLIQQRLVPSHLQWANALNFEVLKEMYRTEQPSSLAD